MNWYRTSKSLPHICQGISIIPDTQICYPKTSDSIDNFYQKIYDLGYKLFEFDSILYEIVKENDRVGYRKVVNVRKGYI